MKRAIMALAALATLASPALARSSLGVFDDWGAFRDPRQPRCYAISKAERGKGAPLLSRASSAVKVTETLSSSMSATLFFAIQF